MNTFAIHANRFILPGRTVHSGYLLIHDGVFGRYVTSVPSCSIVEFGDALVGPGLVDTHIHGYFGNATFDADAQGINDASVELARRGTTSWLPTTFTASPDSIAQSCAAIAEASKTRSSEFVGARIAGMYLEGPFFTETHGGAQNPEFFIDPSLELFDEWQNKAAGLIRKSAVAPESAGALEYIMGIASQGIVACIGHTDASYEQTLAAVDAGASCFVHTFNGMRGLHHREPGVVGAAMSTKDTYAELICDGLHVSPGACAALINAKGWNHVALITDCLGCGGLPDGKYESGGLRIVMSDGVCRLENDDGSLGALAGSIITLAEGVRNVAQWGIVRDDEAVRMATEVAARSAGIGGICGSILRGRAADLTIFGPDMEVVATYVGGTRVE